MSVSESIIHEADVLVIGGGMGGCFAAIKAKEAGASKVMQLDKGHVGKTGCSAFAAGVYAAFCPEEDDYTQVFHEMLAEPAPFLVDQERLKVHLETVWNTIQDMESYGVEFERTQDGKVERHPGRGTVKSVMFHGPQLMEALAKEARRRGVEQINKTMMTDLLTRDGQVVGAVGFDIVTGDWHIFKAKATVLATGINFYKGLCPGHRNITGDGQVASYHAGAQLASLEFAVRNAFAARYDIGPGGVMYVSSGGIYTNARGERFMGKYAPDLNERVQLPTLAFAFAMEVKQGNGPIYLDMTHVPTEKVQRLKKVIPLPMMMYEKAGLVKNDRFTDKMEWVTYAPRSCGGTMVNSRFETSLPGFYACGDAIPTAGSAGGASGLPGAATSGSIAGKHAAEFAKQIGKVEIDTRQVKTLREQAFQPMERKNGIEPDHVLLAVQETVMPYDVLLLRKEERMKKALAAIEDIRDNLVPHLGAYDPHYLRMAVEARNLVMFAELQLKSSLFRKESRGGACLREDYPYQDNVNWLKWSNVKKGKEIKLSTQDIPFDRYPVKPPRDIVIEPLWQRAEELGIISTRGGQVLWG